jgi:hypothetical protein
MDPALLDYVAWDAVGGAMQLQSRSHQRFMCFAVKGPGQKKYGISLLKI